MVVSQRTRDFVTVKAWPGFGGGLRNDLPFTKIPDNAVWDSLNVEFDRDVASKRIGYQAPFLTVTGAVRLIDEWIDATGKQWLIIATNSKIYSYDVAGATLTDRTPVAGLNGIYNSGYVGIPFFGKYYVTNGVDQILYWDGVAALFVFLTTTGAPNKAVTGIAFGSHLLWLNVTDSSLGLQPQEVIWSDFQAGTVYNAGDAALVLLEDTNDSILATEISTSFLAIGRDKSIYISQFIGSPFFYRFDRRVERNGIVATNSFKKNEFGIFGLSRNDIVNFDGNIASKVGTGIIADIITLTGQFVQGSFAYYDLGAVKHRLFVSRRMDGITDTEYAVSILYSSWAKHQYNDLITAIGSYKDASFPKWSDLPNPWSSYSFRWNDPIGASIATQVLYGDSAGKIYKKFVVNSDNGVAIPAYFKTKPSELGAENWIKELQELQFILTKQLSGTLTVYVYQSDDGINFIPSLNGPYTLDMTQSSFAFLDVFAVGEWFYLHIINNNLNETFEIREIRAVHVPLYEREH